MMTESAFADVPGNPGLGALVFISSDQTSQPCPPHVTRMPRPRPAGCSGQPREVLLRVGSQLEEPEASWRSPGPPVWSGASLLWASGAGAGFAV